MESGSDFLHFAENVTKGRSIPLVGHGLEKFNGFRKDFKVVKALMEKIPEDGMVTPYRLKPKRLLKIISMGGTKINLQRTVIRLSFRKIGNSGVGESNNPRVIC